MHVSVGIEFLFDRRIRYVYYHALCFFFLKTHFFHYVATTVDLFLCILNSYSKAQLICSWVFLLPVVNPSRCVPGHYW
jgi:hypothetical protein